MARARYRDDAGKEYSKHFDRKTDGQAWLDEQVSRLRAGTNVTPQQARTTVGEWCDLWLDGYKGHRASTVRHAEVRIARIQDGVRLDATRGGAAFARQDVDLSARL